MTPKATYVKYKRTAHVIETGEIAVVANTDEEAIEMAKDRNWTRYLPLDLDHFDEDWEFEVARD